MFLVIEDPRVLYRHYTDRRGKIFVVPIKILRIEADVYVLDIPERKDWFRSNQRIGASRLNRLSFPYSDSFGMYSEKENKELYKKLLIQDYEERLKTQRKLLASTENRLNKIKNC